MNKIVKNDKPKKYNTPELEVYGGIDDLTQASGGSTAKDLVVVGGTTFPGPSGYTTGSTDIIIP